MSGLLMTLLTAGLLAACGGDDGGSPDMGHPDATTGDTAAADTPDAPAAGDESGDIVDTPPDPDVGDTAADLAASDLGGDDLPIEDLAAADSAPQDLGPQDVPATDLASPDVAPGDVSADAGPTGACLNAADQAVLAAPGFGDAVQECTTGCIMSGDRRKCAEDCLVEGPGLSTTCASCFGAAVDCTVAKCLVPCMDGGSDCTECRVEQCGAAFEDCAGFAMQ